MIRVDFHILNENKKLNTEYLAKLVEKIYYLQSKIFILTGSKEESEMIDQLLWTFRDSSFLPHDILDENTSSCPIQISHSHPPINKEILVNLQSNIPEYFLEFKRIIEIVPGDEDAKKIGRVKYKRYQQSGCAIQTFMS